MSREGLVGLRPSSDWERQIDTDVDRANGFKDRVAEALAPFVPVLGSAGEPLRSNFDKKVEFGAVVRAPLVEAHFHVTWLKITLVGLFWTLDRV